MTSRLSRRLSGLYAPVAEALRPASRLEIHYTITPIDLDGNVTGHTKRRKAHSWTKQAAQIFNVRMWNNVTAETVKETDATTSSLDETIDVHAIGAIAVATHGILVGTGSTAESKDDYVLATPVAEGSGAGQLNHSPTTTFAPVSSITGGYRCLVQRDFTNASGGTIVVAEIGLVMANTSNTLFFLVIRDVLSSTESILTATGRRIEYQADFLN